MIASIVTVIAVVVGITWLGILLVAALRKRGGEEVAPNLRSGISDEEMETRRLERGQKAAIAFSAFLAIALPLYFLTEPARQEGFVDEFAEASVSRGEELVQEFGCFACHGPGGSGGSAPFLEKRSGVTVSWTAPSLNDIFYRYAEDEVNFWITYGRGNTPMPPWGVAGGGPMNQAQVQDIVNYLKTIQVPQAEAIANAEARVRGALDTLAGAEEAINRAILEQEQVVAEVGAAAEEAPVATGIATEARVILDSAGEGIDTDADGLSDVAEERLTELSARAVEAFTVVPVVELDPESTDLALAEDAIASLRAAVETDPIVTPNLDAAETAFADGMVDPSLGLSPAALSELEARRAEAATAGIDVPEAVSNIGDAESLLGAVEAAAGAETPPQGVAELVTAVTEAIAAGSDPDGDGLSTGAEAVITSQVAAANSATIPSEVRGISLDPTNPASVGGEPDAVTARGFVTGMESLATSLTITAENIDSLLAQEQGGLEFLRNALEAKAYQIEIPGVAETMGVSEEEATRAVGLFIASCARCHTAGFSAGIPFTLEAGSGGFGPALWDGRPLVQFGPAADNPEEDLLVQFLIRGSEAQTPYGLNGFGTGRMPAFGASLSLEDIQLLARYLRSGNMDGRGEPDVLP